MWLNDGSCGRLRPERPQHVLRFAGFDDKLITLYARGMTTREIAAQIGELYGIEISPDLVSAVTDAVAT